MMSFIEPLIAEESYECDCENDQEVLYDDSADQLEFMEEGKGVWYRHDIVVYIIILAWRMYYYGLKHLVIIVLYKVTIVIHF